MTDQDEGLFASWTGEQIDKMTKKVPTPPARRIPAPRRLPRPVRAQATYSGRLIDAEDAPPGVLEMMELKKVMASFYYDMVISAKHALHGTETDSMVMQRPLASPGEAMFLLENVILTQFNLWTKAWAKQALNNRQMNYIYYEKFYTSPVRGVLKSAVKFDNFFGDTPIRQLLMVSRRILPSISSSRRDAAGLAVLALAGYSRTLGPELIEPAWASELDDADVSERDKMLHELDTSMSDDAVAVTTDRGLVNYSSS